MDRNTNVTPERWTETKSQMPTIGQKVVVYLWMDKTVNQAWWNGEHYILVAADEQGQVQVYQVLPEAISHWCKMPKQPELNDNVIELADHQLNGTLH